MCVLNRAELEKRETFSSLMACSRVSTTYVLKQMIITFHFGKAEKVGGY